MCIYYLSIIIQTYLVFLCSQGIHISYLETYCVTATFIFQNGKIELCIKTILL